MNLLKPPSVRHESGRRNRRAKITVCNLEADSAPTKFKHQVGMFDRPPFGARAVNVETKATPKTAGVTERFRLPMLKKAKAVHPAIGESR